MNAPQISQQELSESLSEDYLRYAYSVALGRSIPDWRDGMKPVQRRVLFVAKDEGLIHSKPYRKAAKLVGSVLANAHPHGDSAAYDAAIRLGQPWVMSLPLIDIQGNKGSISGDGWAAMRYVETRLTPVAYEYMRDLNENTVDWSPTFDSSGVEPEVLPVTIPNALVNGATGMAVGYATDIPPHNIHDVIKATKHLVNHPDASIEDLVKIIKAPDFPTGGIIVNENEIASMYNTGSGVIYLRAKSEITRVDNRDAIVITELPYLVTSEKLISEIAELVKEKKLEGIHDVHDATSNQSGGSGTRVEITILLKQNADPTFVEHQLFKLLPKQLEISQKFNLNGVIDGRVEKFNLKQILQTFIDFRRDVIRRRTSAELRQHRARLHIIEGLLKILDPTTMDKVIKLIRSSSNNEAATKALMAKPFELSLKQSEAVLAMRLARLTSIGKTDLEGEQSELLAKQDTCIAILKSNVEVDKLLVADMQNTAKISKAPKERQTALTTRKRGGEMQIPEGQSILTLSEAGFVRRVPTSAFNTQNRGGKGRIGVKVKKDDSIRQSIHADNRDVLFLFTDKGRVFQTYAGNIPESTLDKVGVHIRNVIELPAGEAVVSMVPVAASEGYLAVATRSGQLKKTSLKEFKKVRPSGIIAIKLQDGDKIVGAAFIEETDTILVASKQALVARFSHNAVRATGRDTFGVLGISLAEGDEVLTIKSVKSEDSKVLTVSSDGNAKKTELSEFPVTKSRPTKGVMAMTFTEAGSLAYFGLVNDDEDVVATSNSGKTIRVESEQIATLKRRTRGSRLMAVDSDDAVNSVTIISA